MPLQLTTVSVIGDPLAFYHLARNIGIISTYLSFGLSRSITITKFKFQWVNHRGGILSTNYKTIPFLPYSRKSTTAWVGMESTTVILFIWCWPHLHPPLHIRDILEQSAYSLEQNSVVVTRHCMAFNLKDLITDPL